MAASASCTAAIATHKAILAVAFVICFCGWVTSLAGVGSLNYYCNNDENDLDALQYRLQIGVATNIVPKLACSKFYRYQWFSIFLQFLCLILTAVALATPALRRLGLMAALTVSTLLILDNTNTFNGFRDAEDGADAYTVRSRVACAGFLIQGVANFVIMWALGHLTEYAIAARGGAACSTANMAAAAPAHA